MPDLNPLSVAKTTVAPPQVLSVLRVASPAKVNLYLAVAGERADGFHELVTVFERLALADELILEPCETGVHVQCDAPQVPTDERNLIVQAAQLLQQHCGISRGVAITLHKRIPVAAGLGGGSSNAATALRALNAWWELGLSAADLLSLGRELGADIPFFLQDSSFGLGVGRGDVVIPLPTAADFVLWHVLVTPPVALSTADVYATWDTLGSAAGRANLLRLTQLIEGLVIGTVPLVGQMLWNQLTPAAIRLAPEVQEAEEFLRRAGAEAVVMSGSGPTVMALLRDEATAQVLATTITQRCPTWQVHITRTHTARWGVV